MSAPGSGCWWRCSSRCCSLRVPGGHSIGTRRQRHPGPSRPPVFPSGRRRLMSRRARRALRRPAPPRCRPRTGSRDRPWDRGLGRHGAAEAGRGRRIHRPGERPARPAGRPVRVLERIDGHGHGIPDRRVRRWARPAGLAGDPDRQPATAAAGERLDADGRRPLAAGHDDQHLGMAGRLLPHQTHRQQRWAVAGAVRGALAVDGRTGRARPAADDLAGVQRLGRAEPVPRRRGPHGFRRSQLRRVLRPALPVARGWGVPLLRPADGRRRREGSCPTGLPGQHRPAVGPVRPHRRPGLRFRRARRVLDAADAATG